MPGRVNARSGVYAASPSRSKRLVPLNQLTCYVLFGSSPVVGVDIDDRLEEEVIDPGELLLGPQMMASLLVLQLGFSFFICGG